MTQENPTIDDVARLAGVSRAAVSKVLRDAYGVSPAMRLAVTQAMDELHYRPKVAARAMRGATYTIGITLPSLGYPFVSEVVRGVEEALTGSRYQVIVAVSSNDSTTESAAAQNLSDRQVDGMLVVLPATRTDQLERIAAQMPMVVLGRHVNSDSFDTVVSDDRHGATEVVEHLLGLGHTRIAHVAAPSLTQSERAETPEAVRRSAYVAAMDAAGLGDHTQVLEAMPDEASVSQATARAMGAPAPPTAIFAGDDTAAFGVLSALAHIPPGKPGGDVAVVGYGNVRCSAHPRMSLSSVDENGYEMGHSAVLLLVSRIAGRTESVHEALPPRLIARSTSLPAPGPPDSAGPAPGRTAPS